MRRFLMADLLEWRDSPHRKPLVLNGARQVGKTWLLQEFGKAAFKNVAYVSFDNNPQLASLFDNGYDLAQILLGIQAESRQKVTQEDTLIIFDEIQECPKALTSLKYFHEQMPGQAIAAAGSLLGITIHEGTGYPVGKVTTLDLYPLSFREFLDATNESALRELVDSGDWKLIDSFKEKLTSLLRQYYFVGGMPEVVSRFAESADLSEVRQVQKEILQGYERDVSKHLSRTETEYTLAAWNSLPAQLSKENKKYIFGHIKSGARAKNYHAAITWLTKSGLVLKVPRVTKPGVPLSAYTNSAFKLFALDVGLLGAMSGLDERSILGGNLLFTEFKGAFAEQFVCQQLIAECGLTPFYWSAENSRGEIDFVVQKDGITYPIEVKAEENLKSKSLRAFCEKYKGMQARRFSLSGHRDEGWMQNIPLYAIAPFANWK
ncbi:ATP-binding protein [Enterorhabdus sp. NM05_H27]|uniref:AAA family ATPase n=2 Tax=Adlercreutzia mucosicola TaxID=580026 RepID=A0A6N8JKC9_9ACTN|nr:AAA family ATPase [Adlercreutzia mucosicola]TGY75068.1 ATP-binding protein [Enterorhabdus sp. NM05_H27]